MPVVRSFSGGFNPLKTRKQASGGEIGRQFMRVNRAAAPLFSHNVDRPARCIGSDRACDGRLRRPYQPERSITRDIRVGRPEGHRIGDCDKG